MTTNEREERMTKPDALPVRVTYDPVRSIDLRITDPTCGDSRFVPQLAAALRAFADGIENDQKFPWDRDAPVSGFSQMQGDVEIPVELEAFGTKCLRPVRIQWMAAEKLDADERPDDPAPIEAPHEERDSMASTRATAEELAGLTEAEREALGYVWTVEPVAPSAADHDARGWLASNGAYACHVWFDGEPSPDQIGEHLTKTLRLSGIIAEHQQISIIFKDAA